MATNWNVREAAKAINANEKNVISDLGRRFPLATIAIAIPGLLCKFIIEWGGKVGKRLEDKETSKG